MINHARTLLLNVDGRNAPGLDFPGEEYVPESYRARKLPSYLKLLRKELFGSDPDRMMLNYRLRELFSAVHATDVDILARSLDSRITYLPFRNRGLFNESTFAPQVTTIAGTGLDISGSPAPIDDLGRSKAEFAVVLTGGSQVRVQKLTPIKSLSLETFTISNSLSSLIDLGDSGYQFRVENPAAGDEFRVKLFTRPQKDLGQIVANVDALSADVKLELFGITNVEPFLSLRNIWQRRNETPWRIAALVLAIALRTSKLQTVSGLKRQS